MKTKLASYVVTSFILYFTLKFEDLGRQIECLRCWIIRRKHQMSSVDVRFVKKNSEIKKECSFFAKNPESYVLSVIFGSFRLDIYRFQFKELCTLHNMCLAYHVYLQTKLLLYA